MTNINQNNTLNLSLADATYLRWYEITNALSHTHVDAIFNRFRQQLAKEIRKSGSPEITTLIIIQCFQDATQKVAQSHTLRQFESTAHTTEEAAA
jgi:hypothetical protein